MFVRNLRYFERDRTYIYICDTTVYNIGNIDSPPAKGDLSFDANSFPHERESYQNVVKPVILAEQSNSSEVGTLQDDITEPTTLNEDVKILKLCKAKSKHDRKVPEVVLKKEVPFMKEK